MWAVSGKFDSDWLRDKSKEVWWYGDALSDGEGEADLLSGVGIKSAKVIGEARNDGTSSLPTEDDDDDHVENDSNLYGFESTGLGNVVVM